MANSSDLLGQILLACFLIAMASLFFAALFMGSEYAPEVLLVGMSAMGIAVLTIVASMVRRWWE